MATVEELVAVFRVDSKDAVQALDRFSAGIKNAVTATLSLVTAQKAWASFRGVVDATAQMQIFADTTGVSTERLQEWRYAAESMGLSASAVQSDLAKMQQQAAWSGRSLESFADMFKNMSAPVANIWGNAIGISPDTVRLLREGSEGLAKLKQEAHDSGAIISEEDIEAAYEMKRSLAGLTIQARMFGTAIALGVMPFVQKVLDWFKEFNTQNREWIRSRANAIAEGFGRALERVHNAFERIKDTLGINDKNSFLRKLIDTFSDGIDHTKLFVGGLVLLGVQLVKLAVAFAKPVAILTFLMAVIEDVVSFFEGKESVIGDLVDAFQKNLPNLSRLLSSLAKGALPLARDLLLSLWNVLEGLAGFCKTGIDAIVTGLESLSTALGRLLGLYSEAEEKEFRKKETEAGQKAADWELGASGINLPAQKEESDRVKQLRQLHLVPKGMQDLAKDMQDAGKTQAGAAGRPTDKRQGPTITTNNINNDNKVSVTINGLDPLQTALKIQQYIPTATFNVAGLHTEVVN